MLAATFSTPLWRRIAGRGSAEPNSESHLAFGKKYFSCMAHPVFRFIR